MKKRLLSLLLLISIFTEIHNPANRRLSLWGNLYQIQMLFNSHVQCIASLHYSKLLTVRIGNTHLSYTDFFVNSYSFLANGKAPPIQQI